MIAKRGYDLEQRIKTPDINLCKPQTPARSQFDTYPGQVGKIFFRIPTFFPYLYMFPEAFYISPSKQNGLLFCLSCPSPSQFDAELPSYQENHFFFSQFCTSSSCNHWWLSPEWSGNFQRWAIFELSNLNFNEVHYVYCQYSCQLIPRLTGQTAGGEFGLPPQLKSWQKEKYNFS